MVQVKKYPTAYTDPYGWTNPQNILGVENTVCAMVWLYGVDQATLYVKTFGFAIPLNAIIDSMYCNAKGVVDEVRGNFQAGGAMSITSKGYSYGGAVQRYANQGSCAMTAYDAQDAGGPFGGLLTPSDINSENFTAQVDFGTIGALSIAQCFWDSYYLIVNYHIPVTLITVTDSLTIADSALTNKTLQVSDSLGVTDTLRGNKALIINDILAIVDALLTNKTLKTSDALAIADSIKANKTVVVNDALSIADSLLANKTLKATDALAIADLIVVGKILALLDQLSLTDSLQVNKALNIQDILTVSDSVLLSQALKKVADTLIISDSVNVLTGTLQQIIDALSISDSILISKTTQISDTLRISDSITLIITRELLPEVESDEGFPLLHRRLITLSGSIQGTVIREQHEAFSLRGAVANPIITRVITRGAAKTRISKTLKTAGTCLTHATARVPVSGSTLQKTKHTFEAAGHLLHEVNARAQLSGSCLKRESNTFKLKGRNMFAVMIAEEED